ncbi:MAG: alpha-hydroxy-acid oxidizing protein [Stackebrandtia sp.]
MRESVGRRVQSRIYRDGAYGRRPLVAVAPSKLKARALRKLSRSDGDHVAGSAGLETAARANQAAFDHWRIVPRVLTDVSRRDTSIEQFGRRHPTPYLAAPIGVLELAHREADLAVARALGELGVPMVVSSQASRPMEDCAAALGDGTWWFQL